jgi:DNA-binding GntR family transcriptional regulator
LHTICSRRCAIPTLTSSERTLGEVRELILSGDLAAGARLGEAELA